MIQRLEIKSFQCHSDLVFDLTGVTVITGNNDCGKSAVLRCLEWLVLNTWDGEADGFIPWGSKFAEGHLTVDDKIVTRIKGPGENLYVLNGEEMRAIGARKVPEPIAKLLKIGPSNFQKQDEAPFWLSLNGGDTASVLNDIFDLSIIDTTLSLIATEKRQATERVKVSEERLSEARKATEGLEWLDSASESLKALEGTVEALELAREEERELVCAQEEQERLKERLEGLEKALRMALKLVNTMDELLVLSRQQGGLKEILKLEQEQWQIEERLKVQKAKLDKALKQGCPMCGQRVP